MLEESCLTDHLRYLYCHCPLTDVFDEIITSQIGRLHCQETGYNQNGGKILVRIVLLGEGKNNRPVPPMGGIVGIVGMSLRHQAWLDLTWLAPVTTTKLRDRPMTTYRPGSLSFTEVECCAECAFGSRSLTSLRSEDDAGKVPPGVYSCCKH
jgi:hypothetical protein